MQLSINRYLARTHPLLSRNPGSHDQRLCIEVRSADEAHDLFLQQAAQLAEGEELEARLSPDGVFWRASGTHRNWVREECGWLPDWCPPAIGPATEHIGGTRNAG